MIEISNLCYVTINTFDMLLLSFIMTFQHLLFFRSYTAEWTKNYTNFDVLNVKI